MFIPTKSLNRYFYSTGVVACQKQMAVASKTYLQEGNKPLQSVNGFVPKIVLFVPNFPLIY